VVACLIVVAQDVVTQGTVAGDLPAGLRQLAGGDLADLPLLVAQVLGLAGRAVAAPRPKTTMPSQPLWKQAFCASVKPSKPVIFPGSA
jgi:hypothetical protein